MSDIATSPDGGWRITGRMVLMALCAFFGVIFIVNGFLLYFAFSTFSGLEGKSAYEAGLRFEEQAIRAEAQAALGWTVGADVARDADGRVAIDVTARDRHDTPIHGVGFTATLERLTQDDFDTVIPLQEVEPGLYRGAVDGIDPGQWRLVLEAVNADGPVYSSQNRILLLDGS